MHSFSREKKGTKNCPNEAFIVRKILYVHKTVLCCNPSRCWNKTTTYGKRAIFYTVTVQSTNVCKTITWTTLRKVSNTFIQVWYGVIRIKWLYFGVDPTRCIEKCLNTWNIVSDNPFKSSIWIKCVEFCWCSKNTYTSMTTKTNNYNHRDQLQHHRQHHFFPAYQQRQHVTLPWTLAMCSLAGCGENEPTPGIHCDGKYGAPPSDETW